MENINRSNTAGEEQKKLYEAPERTTTANDAGAKKKIMIVGGLAGVVTLVGVILIIVFATQKSKPTPTPTPTPGHHKWPVPPAPGIPNPPPPPPPPPVEPSFRHYNPYLLEGTPVDDGYSYSGFLQGSYPTQAAQVQQESEAISNESGKDGADPLPSISTLGVDVAKIPIGDNNKEVDQIAFQFDMVNKQTMKMVFGDQQAPLVPESVVPQPPVDKDLSLSNIGFQVGYGTDSPLNFNITSPDGKWQHNWVSTYNCTLVVAEKYIQMDFILPSNEIYGFGERVHQTALDQGAWTMWNKNKEPQVDDGYGKGRQSFGTHPFLLYKNPGNNKFGGVFFRNANNQAPIIVFDQTKDGNIITELSYITTGGQVEAYFFIDGTAEEIIQQYQSLFGMPQLPPFYALGWQQSSDNYLYHYDIDFVIGNYTLAGMPLDSVWMSWDSQYKGMPFTIDNRVFMQEIEDGISILQWKKQYIDSQNVKLIARSHPAFPVNEDFNLWRMLNENDAGVKTVVNTDKSKYLTADTNIVKQANFADFLHPKGREIWTIGLESLQSQYAWDGISIEEDGPYTTCDGECPKTDPTPDPPQFTNFAAKTKADDKKTIYTGWYKTYGEQKEISTYKLPFEPGVESGFFDSQTVSLNATMSDSKTTHRMYDVRNMYGLMMAQTTYDAYKSKVLPVKDRRPLIYSQSTFSAASGKVAGHIAAPVARSWDWLRYSVAQNLNMNIVGIPNSGVDVCGTMGTQDEELCAYWYQLAVFSPIARNNYVTSGENAMNEPYRMKEAANKKLVTDAMLDRMRILRYLYTEYFKVTKKGGALIKPMFFSNPSDPDALRDIEQDFMVGEYVKVSPVLEQATKAAYPSYFPTKTGEKWVNIFKPSELVSTTPDAEGAKEPKHQRATLAAGDHVNAYLMPGAIIPMQSSTYVDELGFNEPVLTSDDLMTKIPVDLMINLNAQKTAKGELFIDDGYSQEMLDSGNYDYYTFTYSAGNLRKEWSNSSISPGLPDSVTQTTRMLNSVTFTNAKDMTLDFFCVSEESGNQLVLSPLTKATSTDGNTVTFTLPKATNLYDIHGLYIGDSQTDHNLCTVDNKQWVMKTGTTAPVLEGKTNAKISLQSTDAKDKTILDVEFQLLESLALDQFQDISVKISVNGATPYVNGDVLAEHAMSKAKSGDLSKLLKIVPGEDDGLLGVTPFKYTILSQEDNATPIFDSKSHNIYMSEYLNIWGGNLYTGIGENDFTPAFGLGERVDDFWLKDGIYSFWNRPVPAEFEAGDTLSKNTYGTHPYLAWKTQTGTFASNFIFNTAANDIELNSQKTFGKILMNQISVGGNIHFFVSEARKPETLVKQYHQLVGKPQLPPQWMLGWNQGSFLYSSLADIQAAVTAYANAKIPLEAIWSDMWYMEEQRAFTVNDATYKGLNEYVTGTLHKANKKFVPIVKPGINSLPSVPTYMPYIDGMKDQVFINDYTAQTPFLGESNSFSILYPDWTNTKTQPYWEAQLTAFQDKLAFDALWLSENEAQNDCNGPCSAEQTKAESVELSVPYWPSGRNLNDLAIDVNAVHSNNKNELEMHNVFALQQVKATHNWFQSKKMRTAIASRSSFAGQGRFGGRDFGENYATLKDLMLSVPSVMMMNIFGMTTGAPNVCGYIGDSSPELCARWTKLAAFYPFAKNDYIGPNDHQPFADAYAAVYPDAQTAKTTYTDIMATGIKERYQLIPYLYSSMININQEGGVYFKPMFFDYPEDTDLYEKNYNDFLIGDSLKVSIETSNLGTTNSDFYFPNGVWCSLWAMDEPCLEITGDVTKGPAQANVQTLKSTADVSHVHAKAGSIVPTANLKSINSIMSTADMRMKATDLHIFPMLNGAGNEGFQAYNEMYYTDNGESFESTDLTKGTVNGYQFYFAADPSSENFVLMPTHKVKATKATDQKCMNMSGNDFLGEIFVHNAPGVGIETGFIGVVYFNDGSEKVVIKDTDITYIMNGKQKLVLKIAQQFKADGKTPLCFATIREVRIFKDPIINSLLE